MEDYLERFKAMVEELRAHPDVVVTHFYIRPPAHALWMRKAKSFAEVQMPECLWNFYAQCDGLQLRWIHKKAEGWDEDNEYAFDAEPFDLQFPPDEDGQATGCVNILPLGWVFSDSSWEGIIWRESTSNKDKVDFGGKKYPRRDFLESVRPFDQFDSYYNIALVFAAKDDSRVPLVLGKSHHSDYCSSIMIDWEAYFEFLLKTKGLVAARPGHFSTGLSGVPTPLFGRAELDEVPVLDLNGNDFDE
jgi:hypothetical protein